MAELPVTVFEELAPFRFAEVVAVVSVGLEKEPDRLRFNWVVAELLDGSFEKQAPSPYTDFVAVVSVFLEKEPNRLRWTWVELLVDSS